MAKYSLGFFSFYCFRVLRSFLSGLSRFFLGVTSSLFSCHFLCLSLSLFFGSDWLGIIDLNDVEAIECDEHFLLKVLAIAQLSKLFITICLDSVRASIKSLELGKEWEVSEVSQLVVTDIELLKTAETAQ